MYFPAGSHKCTTLAPFSSFPPSDDFAIRTVCAALNVAVLVLDEEAKGARGRRGAAAGASSQFVAILPDFQPPHPPLPHDAAPAAAAELAAGPGPAGLGPAGTRFVCLQRTRRQHFNLVGARRRVDSHSSNGGNGGSSVSRASGNGNGDSAAVSTGRAASASALAGDLVLAFSGPELPRAFRDLWPIPPQFFSTPSGDASTTESSAEASASASRGAADAAEAAGAAESDRAEGALSASQASQKRPRR